MMWLLLTILLQDPESLKASLRTEDPAVQPQTERLLAVKALSQQLAAPQQLDDRDGTYLVLFTTRACGPCQRWKRDERPKLDAAQIPITIVDVDEDGRWGVNRVPTFWIVDIQTRKPLRKFAAGYMSAETLLPMMGGTQPTQIRATMSHAEMVRLHNSLHGGGSWTWSGDLREHLRRAHGVDVN